MKISKGMMVLVPFLVAGTIQAGGASAPMTGSSAMVQSATAASVASTLREMGYQVTMTPTDPDKEPSMNVKVGDSVYEVWLSSCTKGICSRATATSSWDYSDEEDSLDADLVDEWNSGYFTQAYTSEGSYYLDSTMTIKGGYIKTALKAWFADYIDDVKEFETELP